MQITIHSKPKPKVYRSMKEKLLAQSKGEYLTPDEKKEVQKEAQERRLKKKK